MAICSPPAEVNTDMLIIIFDYVFCVPSLCLCTGRVLLFYRR